MFVRKNTDGASGSGSQKESTVMDETMRKAEKEKRIRINELNKQIQTCTEAARAAEASHDVETSKRYLLLVKMAMNEKANIEKTMISLNQMHMATKSTEFTLATSSVIQAAARVQLEQTRKVDPAKMEALSGVIEKSHHQLQTTQNVIKNVYALFENHAIDELIEGAPVMNNDAISDADLLMLLDEPTHALPKKAESVEAEPEREAWKKILENA